VNFLNGTLKKYISNASSTREWLHKNFNRECSNIVYYSTNAYLSDFMLKKIIGKNPFHRIFNIWDYGWDKKLQTVLPNTVNEIVLENIDNFQGERKIIHYAQPHLPFLPIIHKVDAIKKECKSDIMKTKIPLYTNNKLNILKKELNKSIEMRDIWDLLINQKIPLEEARGAYRKNIVIVLKKIQELLPYLNGKIVITSDHANLFGEYCLYAHPSGLRVRKLVEVPWFEVS